MQRQAASEESKPGTKGIVAYGGLTAGQRSHTKQNKGEESEKGCSHTHTYTQKHQSYLTVFIPSYADFLINIPTAAIFIQ